jgi:RNA polymerase sigma-70 factor (ECF subfamily)
MPDRLAGWSRFSVTSSAGRPRSSVAILARPGLLPQLGVVGPGSAAADAAKDEVKERLTALYAEHGARIHRFLRDLLGDAALAADGTQETFVRAYRKLAELDQAARVAPWLFGIARNVSLELRKARFRAGRYVVSGVPAHAFDPPAPGSPETDYLGREALEVIRAALARLPEERQAMLLLRLDHGLPYEDIAATMGCSLAKVKVEIFRAREVLRATMAEYEEQHCTTRRAR